MYILIIEFTKTNVSYSCYSVLDTSYGTAARIHVHMLGNT